ncbi:MAG: hypothetical protein KAT90_01900, partial [Gammaproteobacteria bacterium]|nr:hypothetical protein [Gammaproteobacteria bacterium]
AMAEKMLRAKHSLYIMNLLNEHKEYLNIIPVSLYFGTGSIKSAAIFVRIYSQANILCKAFK